ncbi:flocculation protein FLO11-like [Lactuca sativa]|uniref:flocculation protein FLO11-like n=1 Tax=Lactuca sativa TaxID=4236 RepID=UPI000CD8D0BC|nr:flocculation protein FLO11-like [Lactuca sativa]
MARKPNTPSTSDSDYVPLDQDQRESGQGESDGDHSEGERGDSPPHTPSTEVPVNDSVPSPPPSPSRTSVPITIAPCPPPISTKPTSSAPLLPPIFSQATSTTSHTTDPPVHVNVSDTGAPTFGSETESPVTSQPLSPSPSTESDRILGGKDVDFESYYFSPYRVQGEEDEDAPVTKRHLKDLNENLDKLLAASSSSSSVYFEAAIKALVETLIKEHDES